MGFNKTKDLKTDEIVSNVIKELWYRSLMTYEQTTLNVLFIDELKSKIYPMGLLGD